ncbi:MAG: GTPase HflX [Phycisphaerales bacterium]
MAGQHRLHQERLQVEALDEAAVLVAVHLPDARFDPRDPLGELRALAETAGARVVGELVQNRNRPEPGTYMGTGKLDELANFREEVGAKVIIFDNDLSPSQIRNIEQVVKCKVIDRSELILDIFAGRATTAAAKLQVELAQLEYTYPRLRAMWSHLGQITGGAPVGIGTRGPGETQIETDRRLVQRRKAMLKRRLAEINRRHAREIARRRRENFTVSLVGYTNAGKSTLFNALTEPSGGGGAYADNRLFATLTTRSRRWPLGSGDEALLSDTVGFVRDLPHHLVASFRATLEDALFADLLLIVLDVSDPQAELQYEVVQETLDALERDWAEEIAEDAGAEAWPDDPDARERWRESMALRPKRLLVLNKIDRLSDHSERAIWAQREPTALAVSARSGEGIEDLRDRVLEIMRGETRRMEVTLPYSAAKALNFAETRGEVLDRDYGPNEVRLTVKLGVGHVDQLRSMGATVTVDGEV